VTLVDARDGRHDLARSAKAALQRVVIEKSLLHRMEAVVVPDPLDRRNMFSVCLHGEGQARYDAPAVDMNRASTALPVVAAFARSGQVEAFTQRVEE
jgi:hypothetical protein